jgi:RNA polymerase sigma-70 factor (ECF subfamily)
MVEAGDFALVRACLDGDEDAFAELLERYGKTVYNVALRMLGRPDDAQDVAQTVFLKVYESLASYDPSHRLYSWIYRIAINESLNMLHRRGRDSDPLDDEQASSAPGPESLAGSEQVGAILLGAVTSLSPEYRSVIVLKYFGGCSYEEAAQILGIEEKTVKSRLFTARRLLKERLSGRGVI